MLLFLCISNIGNNNCVLATGLGGGRWRQDLSNQLS